jgi:hypothetical protein
MARWGSNAAVDCVLVVEVGEIEVVEVVAGSWGD